MRVTRAGWAVRAGTFYGTNVSVECSRSNVTAFLAGKLWKSRKTRKKTLKLQHVDIKWLKRMDLSGSVSVVEKTQCEGKVGENWIPRLSLGGECHGMDLPTREGQPQEKPLD
jgi:hypothetical protein